MKNIVLTTIFIFFVINCESQIIFPQTGLKQGIVHHYDITSGGGTANYSFKYVNDTLANGYNYSRYCLIDPNSICPCGSGNYFFYTRYENKKIFFRKSFSETEGLKYDFNILVGDTFNFETTDTWYAGSRAIVDSISSIILTDGQIRKYIKLIGIDPINNNQIFEWIEGIGDIQRGFLYYIDWEGGYEEFVCQEDSVGLMFHNPYTNLNCDSMIQCSFSIANENIVGQNRICIGDTSILSFPYSYLTYQWRKNGLDIIGANSQFYPATESGSYSIAVNNGNCLGYSNSVNLIVDTAIISPIVTGPNNVCIGNNLILTVPYSYMNYQWFKDGTIITTSTTNNFFHQSSALVDSGFYYCQVENSCGIAVSDTHHVIVQNRAIVTNTIIDVSTFNANDGSINLTINGNYPPYHISWFTGDSTTYINNLQPGFYTVTITNNICISTGSFNISQPGNGCTNNYWEILTLFKKFTSCNCIQADFNNNIYISGTFKDTLAVGDSILFTNQNSCYSFVAKLNQQGTLLWAKYIPNYSTNESKKQEIAVDSYGNCYFTGNLNGSLTFGNNTITSQGSIIIIKYDPNGNIIWAKKSSGSQGSANYGTGIAVDNNGNLNIIGVYSGSISFDSISLQNDGTTFLLKLDNNGNVIWLDRIKGPATGKAINVDNNGNVFITGSFHDYFIYFDNIQLSTYSYGSNVFTAKYDYNGNAIWAKRLGYYYGGDYEYGSSITTDTVGNCYVTGVIHRSYDYWEQSHRVNNNIFICKYNSIGNLIWIDTTKSIYHTNYLSYVSNTSNHICVGRNGLLYITGQIYYNTILDQDTIIANANDIVVFKYDLNGNLISGKTAGGRSIEKGYQCFVSFDSVIYVVSSISYPNGNIYFDNTTNNFDNETGNYWIQTYGFFAKLTEKPPLIYNPIITNNCNNIQGSIDLNLAGGIQPYNIIWSPLQSSDTIINLQPGQYSATISDSYGCTFKNSFVINGISTPSINGQNVICPNDSTKLYTDKLPNITYKWKKDSIFLSSIDTMCYVYSQGNYYVEISDSICYMESLPFSVNLMQIPVVNLGNDTTFCGNYFTLITTSIGSYYNWSTGEISPTIIISNSGEYSVTVTNQCGLSTDSVNIELLNNPNVNLGIDTSIVDSSLILNALSQYANNYLWNTGDTIPIIVVTQSGNYSVTVTGFCGQSIDSINIDFLSNSPMTISTSLNEIKILPNPTKNNFKIFPFKEGLSIAIYNSLGVILYKTDYTIQNIFDVKNLKNGIYFIKIYSEKESIVKCLIKQ